MSQTSLAERLKAPTQLEWLYARDGCLTARDAGGRWLSGCSLPYRAALAVLEPMQGNGRVSSFLAPAHGAQVRVALDILQLEQAIIAICPDEPNLAALLCCDDFSSDIACNRLWFAAGADWAQELERLLIDLPGLPTPAQFIRASGGDTSPVDALIPIAQRIFHAIGERRSASIHETRESWHNSGGHPTRLCVVAPSYFRLWDDAGFSLGQALRGADDLAPIQFDSDNPRSASSQALAVAAAACDALIAPNIGRADLPNVVPLKMPWVTWIVAPRIPAASAAGPNDGLLIADASWRRLAREAGWNNDRVEVAAWPKPRSGPRIVSGDRCVALIADTRPIETPPQVTDFSSHRLLWEFIHEELFRDPFIVGGEVETYLDRRMPQFRIGEHGLDRRLFVDLLIVPAFQQSLARILIHEKVPIQLWGKGWDRIEETRSHAAGLVESREELAGIAGSSSALIYSWPSTYAHPIDGTGCPVLKARASRSDFVRRALMALGEKVGRHDGPAETSGPPITGEAVAKFLRRLLATA